MGAIWTALVFKSSGFLEQGATSAPAAYQVSGLHSVCLILGAILALGTALSILAWRQERTSAKSLVIEPQIK
jgi:hypothetical protein